MRHREDRLRGRREGKERRRRGTNKKYKNKKVTRRREHDGERKRKEERGCMKRQRDGQERMKERGEER